MESVRSPALQCDHHHHHRLVRSHCMIVDITRKAFSYRLRKHCSQDLNRSDSDDGVRYLWDAGIHALGEQHGHTDGPDFHLSLRPLLLLRLPEGRPSEGRETNEEKSGTREGARENWINEVIMVGTGWVPRYDNELPAR